MIVANITELSLRELLLLELELNAEVERRRQRALASDPGLDEILEEILGKERLKN